MPETKDILLYVAIIATAILFLVTIILTDLRRFIVTFNEFREQIRVETDRIADVVAKLVAKANTPQGLSAKEEAEAQDTIQQLRRIGASSEEPIPAPAPTPATDALPSPAPATSEGDESTGNPV